jgi:CHAT domain-containing protein/tetratricopeptide (TPR) repeat protein
MIIIGCLFSSTCQCREILIKAGDKSQAETASQKISNGNPGQVKELNELLKKYLGENNILKSGEITEVILNIISKGTVTDSSLLAGSYYLIGLQNLFAKKYSLAIKYLSLSASLKESMNEIDEKYAKTLYNIGVAYYDLGDFADQERYSVNSLEIEKKIYGASSPLLIKTYSSLIIAYLGLQEYEKSLGYAKIALEISNNNPGSSDATDQADLYNNLGVLYMRLADYSKARLYLEKSESILKINHVEFNDNYFNLLNSLAITYGVLGLAEKSEEYYLHGIDLALSHNSSSAYNYINSYSIVLGNNGNPEKGKTLLYKALLSAREKFGEDSPVYFSVLLNYAEYLREFNNDIKKSLEYYKLCMDYLGKNESNLFLKDPLYMGYALALTEAGDSKKALDLIQSLLFPGEQPGINKARGYTSYENPAVGSVKSDRNSLKILQTKYRILWKYYGQSGQLNILETAASTSRLIVDVLDKVRINISEEDSRLILGDRYRDSYLNAIRDYYLLYSITGKHDYLERAFEFSEKSKVAGLLASTRELKAAQFNIPPELADLERKLQRDISLLNVRIEEEMLSEKADTFLINTWKETILRSSGMRDSLISVFEARYPGYYSIKYNTQVAGLDEISGIIGRKSNYINYVASDSILYIFVANRKKQQLLAVPIDSSFYSDIKQFRALLSMPSPSGNTRRAFEDFQTTGYRLYKKTIEPVLPYLISNKLLISPDNILSYIPMETIPTAVKDISGYMYDKIPYLMNQFDISYTYSATFLGESPRRDYHLSGKLVAFAPDYGEPIDVRSVLMNRQAVDGKLQDLPYARMEAEYVSGITGGRLYENEQATESVFKSESGKYDIIHLAMHTILNDRDPMYSTLIFSNGKDTTNDRYLKTYEIYSIPLRAKMVTLSSCNTGAGHLYSGEGIISLARGFMYSGSESVVMAMWEIEDKSGTEIVKRFYENLKKGNSKSMALKKARLSFLKESDQLRSHPYYWAALVVYGNNSPLYYSGSQIFLAVIIVILSLSGLSYYFWKRKYS